MSTEQKRILLVLGMHRSGTSLLSGWLQQCGIFLGCRLMAEGRGNKKGHFEDLDFHDFHEAIFKRCGIPYGGFENIGDLDWGAYEKEKLQELVALKSASHDQWAFKDPRTLLFLPLYQELPVPWYAIAIFRPYEEVVDSLLRRDWQSKQARLQRRKIFRLFRYKMPYENNYQQFIERYSDYYLNAWIIYNEELLKFCALNKDNVFLFSQQSLLQSDQSILKKIESWGFRVTPSAINSFFESKLMNNRDAISLPFSSDLKIKAEEVQKQLTLTADIKA